MNVDEQTLHERAKDLVNTSVDDMKSGLWFYQGDVPDHVWIIKRGLQICKRRGEKTKLKLLEAKVRQMKKAGVK